MSIIRTVQPARRSGDCVREALSLLHVALAHFMLTGMANPFAQRPRVTTPNRRWAQFSLRTLLASLTIVCTALALWIVPASPMRGWLICTH